MGETTGDRRLKIGELASRLGLNVRTLRYYESIGLLPEPDRTQGGYRLYTEDDEQLLRFVLQAKSAGFSLDEIQRIVRLGQHGRACDYVRMTVERHIQQIDAQIDRLRELRADLSALQTSESEDGAGRICGLIERLSSPQNVQCGEEMMANSKKKVELFVAGCPLCDPVVEMVKRLACDNCEVTVFDLREGCASGECLERARNYGIQRVPAVVVDGRLASCCNVGPVTEAGLREAGIGAGQ